MFAASDRIGITTSPVRRPGSWLRRETDDRPFLDITRVSDVENGLQSFVEDAVEKGVQTCLETLGCR
jgi:hypothetical protein